MEGLFRIVAAVLIGVAAFFLWNRSFDIAFVTAAVGCVSFFLSVRSEVKERVDVRNAEIISEQEEADEKRLDQIDPESMPIENQKPGIENESVKEQ